MLCTLWDRYEKAGMKGTFVGGWVVVILSLEQREAYTMDELESLACASLFTLQNGWVQWQLLHAAVCLQGFSFSTEKGAPAFRADSASFRILSSEDGATWHVAYESHKKWIQIYTFLPCKRLPGLVKYFKLEVLEGELANAVFCIHGILQTPI